MSDEEGYRAPAGGSGDAESEALAELSKRVGRLRAAVFAPILVLGVALMLPAYWVAMEVQWAVAGVAWVAVSGGVAALPLLGGIFLGKRVAGLAIRAHVPALQKDLAQRYGVPEDSIEDLARMFIT